MQLVRFALVTSMVCGACQAVTPPPPSSSAPSSSAPSSAAPSSSAQPAAAQQGAAPAPAPNAAPAAAAPAAAAPAVPAGPASFGAPFQEGPTVALTALLSNPQAYADQQTVITEGPVQRACSRKGCWMEIGEGANACRVTFKDYGFFVPTDSAGARARVQGRVVTQKVEPARVAHLEQEGARFQKREADGSATEVQFIATSVQLTRSGT